MKLCFTNSFTTNTHTLSKLYSRVQQNFEFQPHNISRKNFFYTIKIQFSFIDTATNTSCKVTNLTSVLIFSVLIE